MFYSGRSGITPPTRRNIKINVFNQKKNGIAENLVDLSTPNCFFNISSKSGELTEGYGTLPAQIYGNDSTLYVLPQPKSVVDGMWHYKRYDKENGVSDNRLILHTKSHELLRLNIDKKEEEYHLINSDFSKIYSAQNYTIGESNALLLCTEDGFYSLNGDELQKIENAPNIKSLCIHNERAFATVQGDETRLFFSKSLDPTDWTINAESGGYIDFSGDGGKLTGLISFMGFLFVFREYAIERVSVYADQSDFSIKKVYSSTDRIIEKSIAVCGNKILFISETGLKSFDGANVVDLQRVLSQDQLSTYTSKCVGTYFRGTYILSCYLKILSTEQTEQVRASSSQNNALFLYDLVTGNVEIISDHDVGGFCFTPSEETGEMLFFLNGAENTKIGSIVENRNVRLGLSVEAYWRTGMTDLGFPEKKKFLKSIVLSSKNNITVCVLLDDKKIKFYNVKGTGQKLWINRSFSKIGFYFSTVNKSFKVSNPVVTVDMR